MFMPNVFSIDFNVASQCKSILCRRSFRAAFSIVMVKKSVVVKAVEKVYHYKADVLTSTKMCQFTRSCHLSRIFFSFFSSFFWGGGGEGGFVGVEGSRVQDGHS